MRIPFTKVVGAGNDFVVVDARRRAANAPRGRWAAVSRAWCDRRTGIGADGVLVLEPSRRADVVMRVFNPDGSEAEMCGNGARCVALYVQQGRRHANGKPVTLQTLAGMVSARVRGNRVAMRMTDPADLRPQLSLTIEGKAVRLGFVDTGVPHAVVPVSRLDAVDVARLGRLLRRHPSFAPKGTNVNFIRADARHPNRIAVRTYERGVEAETLACGTGVAASAILHAVRTSRLAAGRPISRRIEVDVRSGDRLSVSMHLAPSGRGVRVTQVTLEGPAQRVFDGVAEWPHHLLKPTPSQRSGRIH